MSLPEIIPSNLPIFVQNKNRSAFANSVIPSGSVLLFAESDGNGGSKLIAKNPDGSFSEVGGGSSRPFYKCASVDTTNHTWTGYLAIVNPVTGVWSFASTATSGLTYERFIPIVGNVYDEACTFQVTNYNRGAVFQGYSRIPLISSLAATAGDELDFEAGSGYEFVTKADVQCLKCNGLAATYQISDQYTTHESSFSFWAYADNNVTGKLQMAFGLYNNNRPFIWCDGSSSTSWKVETGNDGWKDNVASNQQWNHFVLVYQGTYAYLYINGEYRYSGGYFSDNASFPDGFGIGNSGNPYKNYIADVQIWNRRLSAGEVTVLYNNGPHSS